MEIKNELENGHYVAMRYIDDIGDFVFVASDVELALASLCEADKEGTAVFSEREWDYIRAYRLNASSIAALVSAKLIFKGSKLDYIKRA